MRVLDINKLLPPDWPRIDGLLSLSTFDRHVVTLDLPSRRLVVDDRVPAGARSVRARFERAVTGLWLVAFIASRNGDSDIWIEMDSGSETAVIIHRPLAARVGLSTPVAGSGAQIDLRLDGGAPVRTPVQTNAMIFDGSLGLGTKRSRLLTFDLEKERFWIRTP